MESTLFAMDEMFHLGVTVDGWTETAETDRQTDNILVKTLKFYLYDHSTTKQQHQGLKNEANVEILDGNLRLQKQVQTTGGGYNKKKMQRNCADDAVSGFVCNYPSVVPQDLQYNKPDLGLLHRDQVLICWRDFYFQK